MSFKTSPVSELENYPDFLYNKGSFSVNRRPVKHHKRTYYSPIKISAGECSLTRTRRGIQLVIIAPGSRPTMLDNADTFYLVSGGQAGGGTRERNVYDTRGTDVLSVLRVNCALASSRERRPVHRLLRGPGGGRARLKICERASSSRSRPISSTPRTTSSSYYRCSSAVACDFDGGVVDGGSNAHRLQAN